MLDGKIVLTTDQQVRVAFDPYRMRIIETYFKLRQPMTAKQAADILEEPPSKVNYHIKKLHDLDLLEIDRIESINGIQAKYYRLKYKNILLDKPMQQSEFFKTQRGQARGMNYRIHSAWFEQDIQTAHELTFAKEEYDPGYVLSAYNKMYMTKTERIAFIKDFQDLIRKHTTPDDTKEEYTSFIGFARIK